MIECDQVSKRFGSQRVLESFTHLFEAGSKTAITGASGIGKTTLLNVISGLMPIDSGLIRIEGQVTDTPSSRQHPSQRNLGFVFQFPALWPHMTIESNILYGLADASRPERESRLRQIAEDYELDDILKKYPGEISGGQARRVSLARTMIVRPKHLLLDEPLNNLDQDLKDKVLNLIEKYWQETNCTIILVSHDAMEAADLCDRVARFERGGLA